MVMVKSVVKHKRGSKNADGTPLVNCGRKLQIGTQRVGDFSATTLCESSARLLSISY